MKPIFFRVTRNCNLITGYAHLNVEILEHRQFTKPKDGNCETAAEITWQTDRYNQHWYGRTVRINLNSHEGPQAARLTRIAKVIARILPDDGSHEPQTLLDILNQFGAVRLAYDGRLSSYVTEANLPAPALLYWMDDYNATGNSGCTVSVLALDRASATTALEKQFAARGKQTPAFKRWIDAGKPVISSHPHDRRPAEFPSLKSLLVSPFKPVTASSDESRPAAEYSLAAV